MKTSRKQLNSLKGFTLIELLVVITIIAALAITVFVALNPAGRLISARDARRSSDVDTMLTAIHAYLIDNKSNIPGNLSSVEQQLGTATSGCGILTGGCNVTATACLDLSTPMTKYLKEIPLDPKIGTTATTGYSAVLDTNGIVTVRACGTEGTTNIYSAR